MGSTVVAIPLDASGGEYSLAVDVRGRKEHVFAGHDDSSGESPELKRRYKGYEDSDSEDADGSLLREDSSECPELRKSTTSLVEKATRLPFSSDMDFYAYLVSCVAWEGEDHKKLYEENADTLPENAGYKPINVRTDEDARLPEKTFTHVGKTRNPFQKELLHNEEELRCRCTKASAGYWNLEMVIGPFASRSDAVDVSTHWQANSRGPQPRRDYGKFLAAHLDVGCFNFRNDETPLETWRISRSKRQRKHPVDLNARAKRRRLKAMRGTSRS